MIETAITIAATVAAYRGLIAVSRTGAPNGMRATLARWLGVEDRRTGGSGEER